MKHTFKTVSTVLVALGMTVCSVTADQHSGTAAKHDQNKGSDEFSYIFFHGI